LKVLVSGSTGLLGSHLVPFLRAGGHDVLRLVRHAPRAQEEVHWDPVRDVLDARRVEGLDAVVHLAGAPLAARRWSARAKALIHDSRVLGTQNLVKALARARSRPAVLLCASGVGWYGARGDELLDEGSAAGCGFVARVCAGWEEVAQRLTVEGVRVVPMRFGLVLSPRGGALARRGRAFRLGLGGHLGTGNQWMSWVALDDALAVVQRLLHDDAFDGPVNVVAPHPVTNRVFTRTLGGVLRRPAVLGVPSFAARAAFGGLADEVLLASARAVPRRLLDVGFHFALPRLEPALRHLLARPLEAPA
jgi:hypothetical protein